MLSTSVKLPEPVVEAFHSFPQSQSEILRQKAYEVCLDALVGRCAITGEVLFMTDTYHEHRPESDDKTEYNVNPENDVLVESANLGDLIAERDIGDGPMEISFDYLSEVGEPVYQAERQYLQDISGNDFPGFGSQSQHTYGEHAARLLQNGETESEVILIRDVLHWLSVTDTTTPTLQALQGGGGEESQEPSITTPSMQAVWDEASTETQSQIKEHIGNDDPAYVSIDTDAIDGLTEHT